MAKKFVLPESQEAEQALLGCILIDAQDSMKRIGHIISVNDFYYPEHKKIFKTMEKLWRERKEVDIVTVAGELQNRGELDLVGGASYLTQITSTIPTVLHVATYARTVSERAVQRRILGAAKQIASVTQEDESDIDEKVAKVEEIMKGVTRESAQQMEKMNLVEIQNYVEEAKNARPKKGEVQGLSTGFFAVDEMTKGFVPGELMVLSGHTSHGKTQLATNIAYRVAKAGKPVLFVTMEMTKVEMTQRLLDIADDEIEDTLPIYFQSRTDLAYADVARLVERAKEKGVELVVIDHLHYFSRSIENTTAEISKIVKEFKQAAIENNMPIILICHVRKMAIKKRPGLEDIRDSSLIAQDSDMVLMVWRNTLPDATDGDQVEVLLLKNRNRGLHKRRHYLHSIGAKLSEEAPKKENIFDPNARIEGGGIDLGDDDTDLSKW